LVYVLGGIVVLYMVAMAVGALTGRVRIRSCCGVGDPWRDPSSAAASGEGAADRQPAP